MLFEAPVALKGNFGTPPTSPRPSASIVAFAALHLELWAAGLDALPQEHSDRVKRQNRVVYEALRVESAVGFAQDGEPRPPIWLTIPSTAEPGGHRCWR